MNHPANQRRPFTTSLVFARLLVATAAALLPVANAPGQSNAYRLPSTAVLQTPGLAAADALQPSYLPFHRDWRIQTLALPARATAAPSGFASLEYDSSPTIVDASNERLVVASPQVAYVLLTAERNRLFSISVGGSRTQGESSSIDAAPQNGIGSETSTSHNLNASGRLVLIRSLSAGQSLAVGVHASVRDLLSAGDGSSSASRTTSGGAGFDSSATAVDRRQFDRVLSAGIEGGRSTDELDIAVSATYHRSLDFERRQTALYSLNRTTYIPPTAGNLESTVQERTAIGDLNIRGRLNSLSAAAYLRRQSDVENRSVFFLSNIVIGFGNLTGVDNRSTQDQTVSTISGVETTTSSSEIAEASVSQDSNSWLFRVGSGVELHREFGSLYASGGLEVDLVSSNLKGVALVGTRYYASIPRRALLASLPAVAYLEVYPAVHIFAGLSLDASYIYQKETWIQNVGESEVQSSLASSSIRFDGHYPLGFEATHPSGFFAQAAFRGSLTDYSAWRVTIGLDLD